LRAFSDAEVRFLVVGAYAVSFHAEPCAAGQLDLWVDATPENAERVYRALAEFGAPLTDLSVTDLTVPETVFQLGVAPRRIDILTSLTGVAFAEAWLDRVEAHYGGVSFPIIGLEALVRSKRALARPRDLLDLDLLHRHHLH
jgi:hypothetical protein